MLSKQCDQFHSAFVLEWPVQGSRVDTKRMYIGNALAYCRRLLAFTSLQLFIELLLTKGRVCMYVCVANTLLLTF